MRLGRNTDQDIVFSYLPTILPILKISVTNSLQGVPFIINIAKTMYPTNIFHASFEKILLQRFGLFLLQKNPCSNG